MGSRLISVTSPFDEQSDPKLKEIWGNALAIQDYPWGLESVGWQGAWDFAVSPYAVLAESAQDIAATVKFAKENEIKLSIKGTGHDYLGRSNGSCDSLLLWTHMMRDLSMKEVFVPKGAPATEKGVQAITIGAGCRWIEVYREVMVNQGRYVQGGGCTSVGAAGGFLQGGGFGSFSKKYGIAAASLLEAEIVTANGEIVTANAFQNQDLFWALKGGGGATFGIVSKVTLQTHSLPHYFGIVKGKVIAKTDSAFEQFIEEFIHFYREKLNNEHWGEQVTFKPDNSCDIDMLFQGLDQNEAEQTWRCLKSWVEGRLNFYTIELECIAVPARDFWSYNYLREHFPKAVIPYQGGKEGLFYWAGDQSQVMAYWHTMQSCWIPLSLFSKEKAVHFAQELFKASREWEFALHFNKGMAGAAEDAAARSKNCSMNPAVHEAAALAVFGSYVTGIESDKTKGLEVRKKVNAAVQIIRAVTGSEAAYSNEADYFQENWQEAFWGGHYPRLLEIKKKYDPENFFRTHHSVGSEL